MYRIVAGIMVISLISQCVSCADDVTDHEQVDSRVVRQRLDVNQDGIVDYADVTLVRANLQGPNIYDVNQDGRINRRDTAFVLANLDRPLSSLGYRPVRKVHAHIRTWNGNWKRDRLGLVPWWSLDQPHAKAVGTLKNRIERLARGAGVRHFVLQLPGGSVPPRMCASQFWPLPTERRELLKQMARELKRDYPDISLGVYCGWELDPTPLTTEMKNWRRPDWNRVDDRKAMVFQYKGWGEIGFDFITFDAISSQNWRDGSALTWLRYIERTCGLRTIGEAYPLTKRGARRVNDFHAMKGHAWMGLRRYIERRKIPGDPEAARYMALNGHAAGWKDSLDERLKMVSECVEQGYIPWIYEYGTAAENVQLFRHAVRQLARKDTGLRLSETSSEVGSSAKGCDSASYIVSPLLGTLSRWGPGALSLHAHGMSSTRVDRRIPSPLTR